MLNEKQMGRDGQKPETCAVSDKPLVTGDVYFKVHGVMLGIKPLVYREHAENFDELRKELAGKLPPAPSHRRSGADKAVKSEVAEPTINHPAGE